MRRYSRAVGALAIATSLATLATLAAVASIASLSACNGNSPASDGGDGGNATDAALAGDSAPLCDPSGGTDGGSCVVNVSGTVTDETGAPFAGHVISYCADICFLGKTTTDGSFTVDVGLYLEPDRYALLVHARPDHASFYLRSPAFTVERYRFAPSLVVLPLPADGPTFASDGSAQTLTSSGVTISVAAGTKILFDVEDVAAGPVGKQLRVIDVPPATMTRLPFVDAASPPLALYAFSPFEIVLSQPATLTLPSSTGLAPGTAVDLSMMRSLLSAAPPAGPFESIGGGHVSSDGKTITMDPGVGVKTLTWLAVRKH